MLSMAKGDAIASTMSLANTASVWRSRAARPVASQDELRQLLQDRGLMVTQSTLSHGLRQLEEELGMVLFEEPATVGRLVSLALIVAGIVGLKLAS